MTNKNQKKRVFYLRAATDTLPQEDYCADGKKMFSMADDRPEPDVTDVDDDEEVTKNEEDDGITF